MIAGYRYLGVLFTLLLLISGWVFYRRETSEDSFFREAAFVEFDGKRFALEYAMTPDERARGLGERDALCDGCAMRFFFERPGRYAFWMKGMRFPIDIVWFSGDRVVFVVKGAPPEYSGIFDPDVSADTVIEFNAGATDGLDMGERVRFSR